MVEDSSFAHSYFIDPLNKDLIDMENDPYQDNLSDIFRQAHTKLNSLLRSLNISDRDVVYGLLYENMLAVNTFIQELNATEDEVIYYSGILFKNLLLLIEKQPFHGLYKLNILKDLIASFKLQRYLYTIEYGGSAKKEQSFDISDLPDKITSFLKPKKKHPNPTLLLTNFGSQNHIFNITFDNFQRLLYVNTFRFTIINWGYRGKNKIFEPFTLDTRVLDLILSKLLDLRRNQDSAEAVYAFYEELIELTDYNRLESFNLEDYPQLNSNLFLNNGCSSTLAQLRLYTTIKGIPDLYNLLVPHTLDFIEENISPVHLQVLKEERVKFSESIKPLQTRYAEKLDDFIQFHKIEQTYNNDSLPRLCDTLNNRSNILLSLVDNTLLAQILNAGFLERETNLENLYLSEQLSQKTTYLLKKESEVINKITNLNKALSDTRNLNKPVSVYGAFLKRLSNIQKFLRHRINQLEDEKEAEE